MNKDELKTLFDQLTEVLNKVGSTVNETAEAFIRLFKTTDSLKTKRYFAKGVRKYSCLRKKLERRTL